ncbi:vacuolar protein sorting protein 13A [Acrasis kona]|uniref:Vacuolar protein sorting protein 13A n=1 Tax=Acrasis kona TaxID=1008807 RepID=A0AAW2YZU4_9EUKA
MINNYTKKELIYCYAGGFHFHYEVTDLHQFIQLKMNKLQIDNQSTGAAFPVTFGAKNQVDTRPFLHVSICRSKSQDDTLFPYFSINMQEGFIMVDYMLIADIVDFISEIINQSQQSKQDQNDQISILKFDHLKTAPNTQDEIKFYFEKLELHPIYLHLTFNYNVPPNSPQQSLAQSPVHQILNMIGFAFVNVNDAPIRFNALILEHSFMSADDLWDRVRKHYTRSGTREIYKILGSLEIMGNPVGLFNDISTGVKDFFYEPANAITRNPEEFSKGLAKGSKSLLSKSVHGTFNTLSSFTRSIARSLSYLTQDEDRSILSYSYEPLTIKDGFKQGGEAVVRGFVQAGSDVFIKPIKGFYVGGVWGMVKGFGRGLLSIPTKPIVGLLVCATKITSGVSNSQNQRSGRIRHPRMFRDDGTVIAYNEAQSFSHDLLTTANEGRYADTDTTVFYMLNLDKTHVYMLTNRAVMKIKMMNRFVEWRFELHQVRSITRSRKTGSIRTVFNTTNMFGRSVQILKRIRTADIKVTNKFARLFRESVTNMKMQMRSGGVTRSLSMQNLSRSMGTDHLTRSLSIQNISPV